MTNVHKPRPKKKTVSTSVEIAHKKKGSSPVGNFVPSKQMVFDVDKVLAPYGANAAMSSPFKVKTASKKNAATGNSGQQRFGPPDEK